MMIRLMKCAVAAALVTVVGGCGSGTVEGVAIADYLIVSDGTRVSLDDTAIATLATDVAEQEDLQLFIHGVSISLPDLDPGAAAQREWLRDGVGELRATDATGARRTLGTAALAVVSEQRFTAAISQPELVPYRNMKKCVRNRYTRWQLWCWCGIMYFQGLPLRFRC